MYRLRPHNWLPARRQVVGKISLEDVSHTWNLTQAMLRRASTAVENCLLALFLLLVFTLPTLLMDGGILVTRKATLATLIADSLVTCAILYVLLLAATFGEGLRTTPPTTGGCA